MSKSHVPFLLALACGRGVQLEIMKADVIEKLRFRLAQAGAANVDAYVEKLYANYNNPAILDDLLFEARAALVFLKNGFSVELRESPDLRLSLGGFQFYAEVKHFREKEQDRLDDANMQTAGNLLVQIGDTVPLEGSSPWDQIVAVAERKAKQFREDAPNILVIESGSDAVDAIDVPTATNIIEKRVVSGHCLGLVKLNGILHTNTRSINLSRRRNAEFFEIRTGTMPLGPAVLEALHCIQWG